MIWGGRIATVSPELSNTPVPSDIKPVNPTIFKVVNMVHPENAYGNNVVKPIACDKSKFSDVQSWNADCPITVNAVNGVNDASNVQPWNADCPIYKTLSGNVIEGNAVQPVNVKFPILTNPAGRVTSVKLLHAINKLSANAVICDGIVIVTSETQLSKADVPSDVKLAGKPTDPSATHPRNTPIPIYVTLSGNIIDVNPLHC